MNITSVLTEDQMIMNLEKNNQVDVIQSMTDLLVKKNIVTDEKVFFDSVMEREQHATTGIGNGIAIPHGKSDAVKEPAIIYAKLAQPVEWQSLDDKPVEVVIMLAIPEAHQGDTHLKLLSEIAIKLMDDELVQELKQEDVPANIIKLFN